MSSSELDRTLTALFDAERAARAAHDRLVAAHPDELLPLLEQSAKVALDDGALADDESSLRLVRLAALLGEMQGPRVVDLLIDILGCDDPDARQGAGEALSGLAFDRFKEVALGVERALARLPAGSPALAELPYLLAEVAEPGVIRLLGRFLAHPDADAVAAAVEAVVEVGDPASIALLDAIADDPRRVQLEDEGGTQGEATIGELVAEARTILSKGTKT